MIELNPICITSIAFNDVKLKSDHDVYNQRCRVISMGLVAH